MSFTKDTVGKEELTFVKLVVEGLKVEEIMNLFAIFPIDATMQDGGKRKRSGASYYNSMSGAVHTGVEVYRMDSELSGLVEQPWLQLMCCAVYLPRGHNFR